ncbi:hypothetical protein DSO57_1016899 [Entomophthora muscae]|uniref:Uncharacterized protein n=1 Tax=Entomophthora muscae TaxID=34485 RepID=A0ACC2T4L3_9FUNG|nr:hypothetical protein DSO57_1016899 [Entomophthora muscae]
MIVPLEKFVAFTLAPVLLLIWSTTPDLWTRLSLSAAYVGEEPSHLLVLLGNLPVCAHGLVATGGKVVKSLTSNDLALPSPSFDLAASPEDFATKVSPPLSYPAPKGRLFKLL